MNPVKEKLVSTPLCCCEIVPIRSAVSGLAALSTITSGMLLFMNLGFATGWAKDQKMTEQVWSPSSFEVSCQLLTNDLNQVFSVSLPMTSWTALANEGLFC